MKSLYGLSNPVSQSVQLNSIAIVRVRSIRSMTGRPWALCSFGRDMGGSSSTTVENKLLRAAHQNDPDAIRRLVVHHGVDPRAKSEASHSRVAAIHLAAASGAIEAIEMLLELHCDPNLSDDNGVSPLQFACHRFAPYTISPHRYYYLLHTAHLTQPCLSLF